MERIWRWFGEKDKVTLSMLKQIGIEKLITAPQKLISGEVWTLEQISKLKYWIEDAGLKWSIAGDLSIGNDIKYGGNCTDKILPSIIETLANLGESGITSVCYNFVAENNCISPHVRLTRHEVKENIRYFLSQLMPVCEEYNLHISFSPNYFGTDLYTADLECMLKIVDNPYNGFTFNIDIDKDDVFDSEIDLAMSLKDKIQLLIIHYMDYSAEEYQPRMILDKKKKNSLINLIKLFDRQNVALPILIQPHSLHENISDDFSFYSAMYMYAQLDGIMSSLQNE